MTQEGQSCTESCCGCWASQASAKAQPAGQQRDGGRWNTVSLADISGVCVCVCVCARTCVCQRWDIFLSYLLWLNSLTFTCFRPYGFNYRCRLKVICCFISLMCLGCFGSQLQKLICYFWDYSQLWQLEISVHVSASCFGQLTSIIAIYEFSCWRDLCEDEWRRQDVVVWLSLWSG